LVPDLEDRKVTHIQAHFTINAATIALVISRLLNISFSFTAHNIFYTDRVLLKEKVGEAKFIVTISNFSKQFLLNLVPGNKIDEKIHTIHCGISLEEFSPSTNKKEGQVPVLLFVAQLEERKGAPYLIEACKLLSGSGLDYECILIGDGAQKQLVQDLIDKYLLENRVKMVGALPQEKIKSYLDSADIFVLPCIVASDGDIDGIPVSLMEAMAMEIPTVSTRVSGIPELIIDGKSGILVDQKDEVALGNAIQNLIGDPGLRKTLGVNGRQRIIADFNVHKTASELGKLFTDYLGNKIGT
jgi:glycosyltransferase involved in cell wall biosynthesis